MKIQIDAIIVRPGRREADAQHIRELADSIRELGLLNPITIDKDNALIAGLHRLEAAKLLEWQEIECTVSSLEGLQAELAEIDENFVRSDLSVLEYGEMLLRRKDIYETLHPETKAGAAQAVGMNRVVGNNVDCKMQTTSKSFINDTAEKLGVHPCTVARQVQTAKNLTPETKEIIRDADTKISKKAALKLSRLEPERQKEAAALLAEKKIKSVDEYTAAKPEAPEPAGKEPGRAQPEPVELPQNEPEATPPEQPPLSTPPINLGLKHFDSFKESIADLKDPDKDCSCTPDTFLAEFAALVQKFHKEIDWYNKPYYEVVFPLLSDAQLDYLRQLTEAVHAEAAQLYDSVERIRKNELQKKA